MSTRAERDAIREALEKVAAKHAGVLTPEAVVAEAKSPKSVLHPLFEWESAKAAHAWRLEQARDLIRSVRVVITTERTTINTVAYVRDPDAQAEDQGYVSTLKLVGDMERSRSALVAEFSRAAAALRRARELAIAFGMEGECDALAETIETTRTRVEARIEERAGALQ